MEEWLRRKREEEELYGRWAAIQEAINPDQGFTGPQGSAANWVANILGERSRYSGDPEAEVYVQGLREEAAREEAFGEDLPEYGPRDVVTGVAQEEVSAPPVTPGVAAVIAGGEKKEKKTTSDLEKLFLYELMANMRGKDIGQAPAVVAGGGRREFPTMMRQFAPWEREKPYWWIR
jgi:hypothetical protein